MNNKVRAGSHYIYSPNMLDQIDGRTALKMGEEVIVVNLPGCPKAGTMGHCHVNHLDGTFAGLVHVNSLHTKAEYISWLKARIAQQVEAKLKSGK